MKTITQPQSTTQTLDGSTALIKCLLEEGVDTLFGYPGGAIMPVYDVLFKFQDTLKHVLTRHEQGAVHAAQGYARSSGKVGVCMATSGPGATNLITGIADAQIDSTPLVCITGQVPSHLLGTDAFQETDIIDISMPVTKWNYQITSAEEIPEVMAKAFYIAKSGRPGPVLIDITKDAQLQTADFSYRSCEGIVSYQPEPECSMDNYLDASELINNAQKPFILFGQGVLLGNAENEFKKFVEKSGAPCASTLLGLSALSTDHPQYMGMLGMHGNYAPNMMTNECDVLIAIGMRFDDRVTGNLEKYAQQAKVIHLEIDPYEIDKNVKTDVAVPGNCKTTLTVLTKMIHQKEHSEWISKFSPYHQEEQTKVIEKELSESTDMMTMTEVVSALNEFTKGEAIIVTDVGQHQMIAGRYSKFKGSKKLISSGGLGTMGFCLPAAIGAKLGAPDQTVVAINGDGGVQMNIQELGTILQTGVDVKILVLNNQFLGMVRQWQQLFFDKRYASTEMVNPDFQSVAKGYGIGTEKIENREDLRSGLKAMMEHDGSFLLEVMVGQEDNVFPMMPAGSAVNEMILEQ